MCYRLQDRIQDQELLPPAFRVRCPSCSWLGKDCVSVYVYVVGANVPIQEYQPINIKCPKCQTHWKSLLDKNSFAARFKFVVEKVSGFGHHGDVFPCTCEAQPGCRVISDIELRMTTMGDSFINDEPWVRITSKIKCNGCYAEGRIAVLEKYLSSNFYREPWANEVGDHQLCRGVVIG